MNSGNDRARKKDDYSSKYVIKTDVQFQQLEKISIDKIVRNCRHDWFNQTLCRMNNSAARLGIFKGEFHFHKHDREDEFFFVLEGTLLVDFDGKTTELNSHQGIVVPKGVVHRTRAPQRTVVLMIEIDSVTATGDDRICKVYNAFPIVDIENQREKMIIFTIGHSTHTAEEFNVRLKAFDIKCLVDIRTIPKSRFNPQFNQDSLKDFLDKHNIEYVYMKELGGLRHARPDSINTGWENESFRGYADYMQTDDFSAAISRLILSAEGKISAVMCAEAVPWKCHRWLVADALLIRGVEVRHIMNEKTFKIHTLNPMAIVEGKRIIYPPKQSDLF